MTEWFLLLGCCHHRYINSHVNTNIHFTIPVEALTDLYIEGEETYTIEEGDKLTTVVVDRAKFVLTEEARSTFEAIHDEWEMTVCQKYPHDALVGG